MRCHQRFSRIENVFGGLNPENSYVIEILGVPTGLGTGLLGEAPGAVWRVFSRAGINVEHEKKVDLGVLRGADHDGRVLVSPFSTVDGVGVKSKA